MDKIFEIISTTRSNFITLVEGLSIDQLNKIPQGFNNNIIWNFGHIIAAQQLLCYALAQLTPVVDKQFIDLFKKGTKPEQFVDEDQVAQIKKMSLITIDKLKIDREDKIFGNYQPYTTSYNVPLNSVDDAIKFVAVHDGMHYGCALSLRKLV